MRGIMIGIGGALIPGSIGCLYIFGGFLVFTGIEWLSRTKKVSTPKKTRHSPRAKAFPGLVTNSTVKNFHVIRVDRPYAC